MTKQDDSYDSVLIAHEKLVIQKFQTELAGLKSSIVVSAASAPADHHEGKNEHEDVDYDEVSTVDNDTKVESTEFGFNMPI